MILIYDLTYHQNSSTISCVMKLPKKGERCGRSTGNAKKENVTQLNFNLRDIKCQTLNYLNVTATYKNPFKNRKDTINQKLVTKLERSVAAKARSNEGTRVAFLPFVSARKPQKCADKITPTYPIALTIALSLVDKLRSHCAIGKIMFTEVNSTNALAIRPPESAIKR